MEQSEWKGTGTERWKVKKKKGMKKELQYQFLNVKYFNILTFS